MNTSTTHPLPQAIRLRGERFFGTPLNHIRLRVAPLPKDLGARAIAHGDEIWLEPGCDDFARPDNLALIGHELTHILQQRQGRVEATATCSEGLLNDDPRLEAEADELGQLFATQDTCDRDFGDAHGHHQAVVQRSVVVGSTVLRGLGDLSAKAIRILEMTEDAINWLNWAIHENKSNYNFPTEDQLAEGIQVGLHGTNLLLLPKTQLLVNPLNLIKLGDEEIKLINQYELGLDGGSTILEQAVSEILQGNSLLTQASLANGLNFLDELGVATKPVFQAMNLQARIALANLVSWAPGGQSSLALQQNAASFATDYAQSPLEFIDLYQFYITLITRKDKEASDDKHQQDVLVRRYLDVLKPLLRAQLTAASIQAPPTEAELLTFLQAWTKQGNQLGFSRFTSAANQVLQNTSLGMELDLPVNVVSDYLTRARSFVTHNKAETAAISQNGMGYSYQFSHRDQTASMTWLAGCMVLSTYFNPGLLPATETETNEGESSEEQDASKDEAADNPASEKLYSSAMKKPKT